MSERSPAARESLMQSVQSFLGNLRFPQLFIILLALLAADTLFLDPLPFVEEGILLVLTLMAGALKKQKKSGQAEKVEKEPEKNITPTD